nr:hypothetical protein [Akkermansia muciniphila]
MAQRRHGGRRRHRSIICRKKIELGLIPLGAIGFTIGCMFMSFFAPGSLPSNIGFGITGLSPPRTWCR